MTRHHYRLIAEVLAAEYAVRKDQPAAAEAIRCAALGLADRLLKDNPRFSRARFYAAIGL
jgi:hypothetical protein